MISARGIERLPLTYDVPEWDHNGVYAIINEVSGRLYIGYAGRSFRRRWLEHRSKLTSGKCPIRELQADWNELGPNAFVFSSVWHRQHASGAGWTVEEMEAEVISNAEGWLYNSPFAWPRQMPYVAGVGT